MSYPFAGVDPTGLPIADETAETPDRIRQGLFNRLRWAVFSPQHAITVQDGDALTPFATHASVAESIADPPVSRITVRIQVCEDKASTDHTDEEAYRYRAPEPLVIENRNGAPILLRQFVELVHVFLDANRDEIYKCEDENYSRPVELEGGIKFDGVDPAEFDGVDGHEDGGQSTEPSFFIRSGNIPPGSAFFFDEARFNEVDADDFEVYVCLFVEGNMGISSDQFWRCRMGGR